MIHLHIEKWLARGVSKYSITSYDTVCFLRWDHWWIISKYCPLGHFFPLRTSLFLSPGREESSLSAVVCISLLCCSFTLHYNYLFTWFFLLLNCEIHKEVPVSHICVPNISHSVNIWKNILNSYFLLTHLFFNTLPFLQACPVPLQIQEYQCILPENNTFLLSFTSGAMAQLIPSPPSNNLNYPLFSLVTRHKPTEMCPGVSWLFLTLLRQRWFQALLISYVSS